MADNPQKPGSDPKSPNYLKSLTAQGNMLSTIWNIAPCGITIIVPGDKPGEILIGDVNPAACKAHGYAREELVGKSMDFTHEIPWTHTVGTEWFETETEEAAIEGQALHRHKDGTNFKVNYSVTFVEIDGVKCAIGFDYLPDEISGTDDKLANRWMIAMGSSDDAIWDLNVSTKQFWTSGRWQAILGYPHSPITFDISEVFSNVHPSDREKFEGQFAALAKREIEHIDIECKYSKNKDEWIWVNLKGRAHIDSETNQQRVLGSMSDITLRKKSEKDLRIAREKAEAASNAKTQFLAVMSHEIRTPMNGVLGMASLLSGTPLTEEQQVYLKTIESSGDSLLTIIDEILNFSKLEAGSVELESKEFDLVDCVHGALSVVSSLAVEKGLELLLNVDPNIPKAIIGDSTRIRQVVINLVGNAIKFTSKGEVELSIAAETNADPSHSKGKNRYRISIRDTGIGIPPQAATKLFEPFSQVDASTTRTYGGTGLGLAICKRLLKLMNGDIEIESESGVGSTFNCLFEAIEIEGKALSQNPKLANKRILLVEDNERSAEILSRTIETLGASTILVTNSGFTLDTLQANPDLDCILIDSNLTQEGNQKLATAIRDNRQTEGIRIISLESLGAESPIRNNESPYIKLIKPATPKQIEYALLRATNGKKDHKPHKIAQTSAQPTAITQRSERILLVEDNKVNQLVAGQLLGKQGYTFDIAESGFQALEFCAKKKYDIIFMDLQMPGMNGIETVERIRGQFSDTPESPWIIALTADAMEGDREKCIDAGMNDYLPKPIRPAGLTKKLENARSKIS